MTTLHTLRRHYDLSLGELAQLTGISLRRLAEYEYEDRPLPPEDQRALLSLFSVQMQSLGSGWDAAAPVEGRGTRQSQPALLLAGLAATAALGSTFGFGNGLRTLAERIAQAVPAAATRAEPGPPPPTPARLAAAIVLPVAPLPTATAAPQPTATVQPTPRPEPPQPHRCPVESERGDVVIMAGYTAGTHEPTRVKGAVDLAIDANGDGLAEPWASRNATVHATHGGVATVALDSWPDGNYVVIEGADGWRSGYAHLQEVAIADGDRVETGQQIGAIGASGQAGGPHLDYRVWYNNQNVDPTALLRCD